MAGPSPDLLAEDELADVIDRYRQALNSVGSVQQWSLDQFDRTGIPVEATVWTGRSGSMVEAHGVGYGATRSAATVGALGEVAERVISADTLQHLPTVRAGYRQMVTDHGRSAVADPVSLTLPAGSDYTPDRPMVWVPSVRWRTGEQVWVPIEFIANDPSGLPADGPPPLITPITNGLGAGDSIERAVGHALLELVQRDGDTVSFRALDQGVVIDLNTITDPAARAVIARLRRIGIEPIVKLASTEFACVVYAMGRDASSAPAPLALTAIGEAAHPDGASAITAALLEYASSRARRAFAFGPLARVAELLPSYYRLEQTFPVGPQEPRALLDMREWAAMDTAEQRLLAAPMLDHHVRDIDAADLPSSVGTPLDPAALLQMMLERLSTFDVLTFTGHIEGIFAAKVLAPGLEVETMSYLRIGSRVLERLAQRHSPLVGYGYPSSPDQLPVMMTAEQLAATGPAWIDREQVEATVGHLYPLYREPRRHAVDRGTVD